MFFTVLLTKQACVYTVLRITTVCSKLKVPSA